MIEFNHFNFNVLDLEKVLHFIRKRLVFPSFGKNHLPTAVTRSSRHGRTGFSLELTWLRDRKEPYNLGDESLHWLSKRTNMMLSINGMKRWAVSAMRTLPWAFILLMIRTDTGLRSYPSDKADLF